MIWFMIFLAVINIICSGTLLFLYIKKNEECVKLKEELEKIYVQVNQGTLKEWMSKTEDEAWRDL